MTSRSHILHFIIILYHKTRYKLFKENYFFITINGAALRTMVPYHDGV